MGTLWCGWVSDTYQISRTFLCEISSIIASILIIVMTRASSSYTFLLMAFLLGFFLYIPASFSELLAIEGVDAKYTGLVISMNGLVSPFGNVCSGIPVNWIIQKFGWGMIPKVLSGLFVLFTVVLWINSYLRKHTVDSKDV